MAGYYDVQEGDCISSIAYERGFFWKTLWNHPNNADLKKTRGDPNILYEGDQVYVPDLRIKEESRATEQRYVFKLNGVPAKFRLRVMYDPPPKQPDTSMPPPPQDTLNSVTEDPVTDLTPQDAKPRANLPYSLQIGDTVINGTTDSDGLIKCSIPPNARSGQLTLEPGTDNELTMTLRLGRLDPLTEVCGVKERLAHLGYDCGDLTDDLTDGFAMALSAFQEEHGLPTTGEVDDAVRDKLKELHGS